MSVSFRCGLFCENAQKNTCFLTLQKVDIEVHTYDLLSEVTVRQHYTNQFPQTVEAYYKFPLDENSAINGFEASFDGKTIKGCCKKKEEAKLDYTRAVQDGKQASLFEQEEENIFTTRVGNLAAGKTCVVSIKYTTHIDLEGTKLRANFPMWLAPRYTPSSHSFQQLSQWDNRPNEQPKQFSFKMFLSAPSDLISVSSPSHPELRTQFLNTRDAQLEMDIPFLQKNLVILFEHANIFAPRVMVEESPDGKSAMAMVSIAPKPVDVPETLKNQAEIFFVLDRSGSMSGPSILAAKDALMTSIRSMSSHCFFNVISFGSDFSELWSTSRVANSKNVDEALTHVKDMEANMGGTEILQPLLKIFQSQALRSNEMEVPRVIFIFTDGGVSNTDKVVQVTGENAIQRNIRVFTIGIGDGVDRSLCKRISKAGYGSTEFVSDVAIQASTTETDDNDLTSKIVRQLTRALSPALTNVQVQWPKELAGAVETWPTTLPAMESGQRYLVYGKIDLTKYPKGLCSGEMSISANVLFGASVNPDMNSGIAETRAVFHFDGSRMLSSRFVHTLAARERIRELDEIYVKDVKAQLATQSKIEALALQYNLASRFTSFVAVDESTKEVQVQRVEKESGAGEQESYKSFAFASSSSSFRSMGPLRPPGVALQRSKSRSSGSARSFAPYSGVPCSSSSSSYQSSASSWEDEEFEEKKPSSLSSAHAPYQRLLVVQDPSGSIHNLKQLFQIADEQKVAFQGMRVCEKNVHSIKSALQQLCAGDPLQLFACVLFVYLLTAGPFASYKSRSILILGKTQSYLRKNLQGDASKLEPTLLGAFSFGSQL